MSQNKTRKVRQTSNNRTRRNNRTNRNDKNDKNDDGFELVTDKDYSLVGKKPIKRYNEKYIRLILSLKYRNKSVLKSIKSINYNDRNINKELELEDIVKIKNNGSYGLIVSLNKYRDNKTKNEYIKYCVQKICNWNNKGMDICNPNNELIKEYNQRDLVKIYNKKLIMPFNYSSFLKMLDRDEVYGDDDDEEGEDNTRSKSNQEISDKEQKKVQERIRKEIEKYVSKNRLIGKNVSFYVKEMDKEKKKKAWTKKNIIKYNLEDIDFSKLPVKNEAEKKQVENNNDKGKRSSCNVGIKIINIDIVFNLEFGKKLLMDERGKIIDDPLADFQLEMSKKFEELGEKFGDYCDDKRYKIKGIINGIGKDIKDQLKQSGVDINNDTCKSKKITTTQKGGKKCYPLYKHYNRRKRGRRRTQKKNIKGRKSKITRKMRNYRKRRKSN
tara:strand:+ start:626 stop:1945 length:1320 start_codon:yes stop_codon:yes gene_type:complete